MIITRLFTVVGEGQRPDMAFSTWIAAARAGEPVRIFGSIDRSRDFTDVRHVVAALIALAHSDARGVVNVGTGVPHTLQDSIAAIETATGFAVRTVLSPAAVEEVAHTRADTTRLHDLIGWTPSTDLIDVIRRVCEAVDASSVASTR